MNSLAAWLIFLIYLAFALPPFRKIIKGLINRIGDWIVGFLLLPYLLAVNFQPAWEDLLRMAIFITLPTLLLRLRPRKAKPFDFFQILAFFALWIPIEPSLFILLLDLIIPGVSIRDLFQNLDLLPDVSAPLFSGVSLPIPTLIAVSLALYLFFVRHPLKGIGFSFRITRRDLKLCLQGLLAYGLIGLHVGILMGFLRFDPTLPSLLDLVGGILAGYLFVALIEEVLFRGVIQNLLAKRLKNENIALIISAVIFGLAHLNNATQGFPVPNWAYVLMATLAGLAYGWVWQRTRKVTVSAITHMLVNLVWGLLLT